MKSLKACVLLPVMLAMAGCDFYSKAEVDALLAARPEEMQPVSFLAKLTAEYDWPLNASVQQIVFGANGTVLENEGSAFSAGASTFRVPESGVYDFTGRVYFRSIAAGDMVYVYLKAGDRSYYGDWCYSGGTAAGLSVSVALPLEEGTLVQLWGYINSSTPPGKVYGNGTLYLFTSFAGVRVR